MALRVVNRIEKEVVEAEYESWLKDETHKCSKIGAMLDQAAGKGQVKEVESWVNGYCGDCESSLREVEASKKGLY